MFQSYEEFIREYRLLTNNSQATGYQEAPYGYDSAWAVAFMLNRSIHYLNENGKDTSAVNKTDCSTVSLSDFMEVVAHIKMVDYINQVSVLRNVALGTKANAQIKLH